MQLIITLLFLELIISIKADSKPGFCKFEGQFLVYKPNDMQQRINLLLLRIQYW